LEEEMTDQINKINKSAGSFNAQNRSMFVIDDFVATQAGEPYRLLKFGIIKKGGRIHVFTPEVASQFKLPPFKPAIKLGSHEETTPSGGSIVKLEVRSDGLYAYPEFTAKGHQAIAEGNFRYHSPEIVWEDGAMETNDRGWISGPLVIGDALLHTPHLGEAAALYSAELTDGDPVETLQALIQAKQNEKGFENYDLAFRAVRATNPEILAAYDEAIRNSWR
jgi:hypothetical protein